MDVLIETHNAAEIERAARLRSPLIGVNNRNLKTMDISLDVGKAMLPLLPQGRIAVAESGLFSADDLADMASAGARCFLIGESLMRQQDVASATAHILANPVQKAASS
jgi:indole-3-glycerol phosphate synthase